MFPDTIAQTLSMTTPVENPVKLTMSKLHDSSVFLSPAGKQVAMSQFIVDLNKQLKSPVPALMLGVDDTARANALWDYLLTLAVKDAQSADAMGSIWYPTMQYRVEFDIRVRGSMEITGSSHPDWSVEQFIVETMPDVTLESRHADMTEIEIDQVDLSEAFVMSKTFTEEL